MEALLVIAVLAAAVAAGVVISRRRSEPRAALPQRTPQDDQRALHGDARRLRPRDVVAYEGTDYVVDRTMRFDEDGFTWDEHLLTDAVAGRKLWISVEDDEGVEVAVYEQVAGADLSPDATEVAHDGVTYTRQERGRARFRVERADDGPGEQGEMEYADFRAGERLLAFERYGSGGWEVSTGQVVSEHALDIFPAS